MQTEDNDRWSPDFREIKKVRIAKWADKYTARLDREMRSSWPDLERRLVEGIGELSWVQLMQGSSDFNEKCVKPSIQQWSENVIRPTIQEATEDFATIFNGRCSPKWDTSENEPSAPKGQVYLRDALGPALTVGGPAAAAATVAYAVTTTTTFLIFTTTVILWPVLIVGLIAAGVITAIGAANLASFRSTLEGRARKDLLPPIKESLVGLGTTTGSEHVPSVLEQLCGKVTENATVGRNALDQELADDSL
jgi:hypothetical protein